MENKEDKKIRQDKEWNKLNASSKTMFKELYEGHKNGDLPVYKIYEDIFGKENLDAFTPTFQDLQNISMHQTCCSKIPKDAATKMMPKLILHNWNFDYSIILNLTKQYYYDYTHDTHGFENSTVLATRLLDAALYDYTIEPGVYFVPSLINMDEEDLDETYSDYIDCGTDIEKFLNMALNIIVKVEEPEQLVSYEQAKRLRNIEYDYPSVYYYDNGDLYLQSSYVPNTYNSMNVSFGNDNVCDAPTLSAVQKWFREKHKIDILINKSKGNLYYIGTVISDIGPVSIKNKELDKNNMASENGIYWFDTYEDALSSGIDTAISLVENKYQYKT